MAILNKTGITNGGTIQAEHVTRTIDALSGVSTDTIVATGSFSGSFMGDGSQLSGVSAGFPFTGSARITGSLAITGSLRVVDSIVASGSHLSIISDSVNVGSSAGTTTTYTSKTSLNLKNMSNGSGFVIPATASSAPALGSMYFDETGPTLWIFDGANWRGWEPTL
jgi:hypothetical protein